MLITKMWYQCVLLLYIITYSSFASIVRFLPTTSFDLPINFKDGKLPCSQETVVFPDTLLTSVRMESEISVSGLILPIEGDIILADGTILFGKDDADVNCTQGNTYYLQRGIAKWSQPDIWSSPKFNDATPDAERMPCFDDIVEFPSNGTFTLTLPDRMQILRGLKLGNYSCNNLQACFDILNSEGRFVLNNFLSLGLVIEQQQCLSRSGCPCQKNLLRTNCESKYCSVPTCVDPIKPKGHCCKICGGVINFDIDESFDIMTFKELVDKTVESYGIENLIYHLGRLPNNKVQLVVIEKPEYTGVSVQVVNDINNQMKQHWVQGAKMVSISGIPLDKSGLGGKIFISMFFLVVLVMSGIYVYYYKLPEVSDVRFPNLHRTAPGVFTRFQSRTDSVVCLTRRDSEIPIGSGGTAFRNPLYDSTRQHEEEIEETNVNELDKL